MFDFVCCAYSPMSSVPSAAPPTHNGDMPVNSTTTVARLIEYWRLNEGRKYTARSFATKNYYTELLLHDLGDRLAESVTVADLLEWYASEPSERQAKLFGRRKRSRVWSEGTKKNVARTIVHLFNLGERDGLIERHRLKALVGKFEKGDQIRAVTQAEYDLMWEHATDDAFRNYIEFIRESGARPGEAAALTWEQIDWEKGQAVQRIHKTIRKTGKPRKIPLSERALELLCELEAVARDRANGGEPTGHVFRNGAGRKWSSQCLTKRMETVRRRGGLGDDVHLHGIRKLAASSWAAKGMPPKLIAEILGHTDTKITEECYVQLDGYMGELRGAMARFV